MDADSDADSVYVASAGYYAFYRIAYPVLEGSLACHDCSLSLLEIVGDRTTSVPVLEMEDTAVVVIVEDIVVAVAVASTTDYIETAETAEDTIDLTLDNRKNYA